jgi:hypothetical protein
MKRYVGLILPLAWLAMQSAICGADTDAPIKYSFQADAAPPDGKLEFRMENTSAKPIAAFVLRFVYRDKEGKTSIVQTYGVVTRGLGLSKGRASFQPGEQWSDAVKASAGEPSEVQLDLVMFEDGTNWGPNKSKYLERYTGMQAGAKMEREK